LLAFHLQDIRREVVHIAWSTLPTYSDGNALTAAHLNAIAANINATAVAVVTTAGDYVVATGTNALVRRHIASDAVTVNSTTTSGSYTNPTGDNGPVVTATTGAAAIIFTSVQQENLTTGDAVWSSFGITGATTDDPEDNRAIMSNSDATQGTRQGVTTYMSLTAGSNTFRMLFRVSGGKGEFDDRRLTVFSL